MTALIAIWNVGHSAYTSPLTLDYIVSIDQKQNQIPRYCYTPESSTHLQIQHPILPGAEQRSFPRQLVSRMEAWLEKASVMSPAPFCKTCSKVVSSLYERPEVGIQIDRTAESESCPICRFFRSIPPSSPWRGRRGRKNSIGFLQYHPWVPDDRYHQILKTSIDPGLPPLMLAKRIGEDDYVQKEINILAEHNIARCNQVRPTVDFTAFRNIIAFCSRNHGPQCRERQVENLDLPTKLIECKTLSIIPASPGAKYVTLSYVWGNQDTEQLLEEPNEEGVVALPEHLPATIQDTTSVCLQLGYQYLWIDKFCIPQNDLKERHRQIQNMDAIYGGSK